MKKKTPKAEGSIVWAEKIPSFGQ